MGFIQTKDASPPCLKWRMQVAKGNFGEFLSGSFEGMRSKSPRKPNVILPVEEFEFGEMEAAAGKQVKAST